MPFRSHRTVGTVMIAALYRCPFIDTLAKYPLVNAGGAALPLTNWPIINDILAGQKCSR
jgi:hypothetical protein